MSTDRHPDDGQIVTRRQGDVLVITIDRPKKLNGFSAVMLDELSAAFSAMERDPDVRCGLLCAEGNNFTAGLELSKLSQRFAEGKPLFPVEEVDPVNLRRLRTKPLVAAVQGICYTIGIELMLAADVVIAASDCRFAQLEVRRGIMATAGATIRIARGPRQRPALPSDGRRVRRANRAAIGPRPGRGRAGRVAHTCNRSCNLNRCAGAPCRVGHTFQHAKGGL